LPFKTGKSGQLSDNYGITSPGGFPVFIRVVKKSGYRTIRLILKPPADKSPDSQAILDELRRMGCTYEGAHPGFLALDVPPGVDLQAVRAFLISTGQEWEHGDPTYEDLFPEPPTAPKRQR